MAIVCQYGRIMKPGKTPEPQLSGASAKFVAIRHDNPAAGSWTTPFRHVVCRDSRQPQEKVGRLTDHFPKTCGVSTILHGTSSRRIAGITVRHGFHCDSNFISASPSSQSIVHRSIRRQETYITLWSACLSGFLKIITWR